MINKIIELRKQNLNSFEISNKLNISKQAVDLILLDFYFKNVRKHKVNDVKVKEALCKFHENPEISLKSVSKLCNCTSAALGNLFKRCGIYLSHKSNRISYTVCLWKK